MASLDRPGKYRLRARVRDPRDFTAGIVSMALVEGANPPAPSGGWLSAGWEAGTPNTARLAAALDTAGLDAGAHSAFVRIQLDGEDIILRAGVVVVR